MSDPTIEPCAPSDWLYVAALLADWPFKPLASHDHWPVAALTGLCLARVARGLQLPQTEGWLARSPEGAVGFASLSPLPWDSEQLGLSAARLDYLVSTGGYPEQHRVKQILVDGILEHCAQQGIQHLSTRLDASDLSGLHVLEQDGFITLDGILTFAADLQVASVFEPDQDIRVRLATPADGEAAADLARQAYVYDRFHSDPAIPWDRADELHANWLRNSCTAKAADAVVLSEDGHDLLGFVTCRLQPDTKEHLGRLVGTIALVATAGRVRGRGVARSTTLAALDWFRQQGADIVEVGTQLRNIPAARLYQSCGFHLVGSSISLRRLL